VTQSVTTVQMTKYEGLVLSMNSILVVMHYGTNIGYAIEPLEHTFFQMALNLVSGDQSRIHFSYTNHDKGRPRILPEGFENIIVFDYKNPAADLDSISDYIKTHKIDAVFGFDLPIKVKAYSMLRSSGVRHIISYYGAPMSSINKLPKLLLKKVEVALTPNKPDHFIFESEAMRQTAVNGRGVRFSNTSVVPLGVDIERYSPADDVSYYAHDLFDIPRERKIAFYSGHMQERKGVDVIVKAGVDVVCEHGVKDLHFLFFGNKDGEEEAFSSLYRGTEAEDYITFGGYRNDLPEIMQSCAIGTIASTGWDSFPRSAVEMAACGLPLVVSRLQGLVETVEEGVTGYTFVPRDFKALSQFFVKLSEDEALRKSMSAQARKRIVSGYSIEKQTEHLSQVVRQVTSL